MADAFDHAVHPALTWAPFWHGHTGPFARCALWSRSMARENAGDTETEGRDPPWV